MRPIVLPVVQYSGPEHDIKLLIKQYKGTIPEFSLDLKGRLFIRPFFMPPLPGWLSSPIRRASMAEMPTDTRFVSPNMYYSINPPVAMPARVTLSSTCPTRMVSMMLYAPWRHIIDTTGQA